MSRNSLFNLPSFRKPRRTSLADQTPDQLQEQVSKLENILVERDSIITALEGELRRVQQELERSTGVVKRQHPLVPVVHEVEDKMTKKRRFEKQQEEEEEGIDLYSFFYLSSPLILCFFLLEWDGMHLLQPHPFSTTFSPSKTRNKAKSPHTKHWLSV